MDLIQNELIEKALALNFKSYFGVMTAINKECYYLWMCDLQYWLKKNKGILILVLPQDRSVVDYNEDKFPEHIYFYCIINYNENCTFKEINSSDPSSPLFKHFYEFEDALETALLEALKLIQIMEDQNILEDNKLIAEFIDLTPHKLFPNELSALDEISWMAVSVNTRKQFDEEDGEFNCFENYFEFHNSWEWLIPVIKKIYSMNPKWCKKKLTTLIFMGNREDTWKLVIKFIKQNNKTI